MDKIQSPAHNSYIALWSKQRYESSSSPLFIASSYALFPRWFVAVATEQIYVPASDSHPAGGIPGFLVRLFSINHLCNPRSMQRTLLRPRSWAASGLMPSTGLSSVSYTREETQTRHLFFTTVCFLSNELFWLVGNEINQEKKLPGLHIWDTERTQIIPSH